MEEQMTKTKGNWGGFSKKTLPERLDVLDAHHLLSRDNLALLKENKGLSLDTANQLTENVRYPFLWRLIFWWMEQFSMCQWLRKSRQ